jgi:hypothetical protein
MMTTMMKSNANAHFTPPPWGYSGASWLALRGLSRGRALVGIRLARRRKPEYTMESYEPELQAKVANGYLEGKNI